MTGVGASQRCGADDVDLAHRTNGYMAPSAWNNQPSDMEPHNKLLGVVTAFLGFAVLAVAVAFADAMKDPTWSTAEGRFWTWPQLSLPGLNLESAARDPLFYVGFVACFGWWWVLLGRPAYATKA